MKFEPGILAAGRPAALGERADARSGGAARARAGHVPHDVLR